LERAVQGVRRLIGDAQRMPLLSDRFAGPKTKYWASRLVFWPTVWGARVRAHIWPRDRRLVDEIPLPRATDPADGSRYGRLFVGVVPALAHDVQGLIARLDIAAVVDVCAEWPGRTHDEYRQLGCSAVEEVARIPIPDMTVPPIPELERGADFVRTWIERKKKNVYVHCKAGRGRSVAVVLAYLVKWQGLSAEEAQKVVHSVRPHVYTVFDDEKFQAFLRHLERA
jgi:atypical dual specificity phosphatase